MILVKRAHTVKVLVLGIQYNIAVFYLGLGDISI